MRVIMVMFYTVIVDINCKTCSFVHTNQYHTHSSEGANGLTACCRRAKFSPQAQL